MSAFQRSHVNVDAVVSWKSMTSPRRWLAIAIGIGTAASLRPSTDVTHDHQFHAVEPLRAWSIACRVR